MLNVGIGSAIGAVLRYLLTQLWKKQQRNWPLATLLINVSGAFLLGLLTGRLAANSSTMLFLGTGILGGYTTFSTFNTEMVALIDEHRWGSFWLYLIASYGGGLVAAWIGMQL